MTCRLIHSGHSGRFYQLPPLVLRLTRCERAGPVDDKIHSVGSG